MSLSKLYLQTTITRLLYYKDLGEKAMAQLNDAELNYQPGPESNSVAVIVRHLGGNMLSRWTNFLKEDGEKEWRQRDDEFREAAFSRTEIMEAWDKGWACFLDALKGLKKKDLKKTIYIRKEGLTVIDAINRQLAHYPYHIGQIVYLARMIRKDEWKNLSIPKGGSAAYNNSDAVKDPAKAFKS